MLANISIHNYCKIGSCHLTVQESNILEFKKSFLKNVNFLTKYIIAFANASGGAIIFGVKDDGYVCGINKPDNLSISKWIDDINLFLDGVCQNNIIPAYNNHIKIIIEEVYVKKYIIRMHISSPNENIIYKRKSDGMSFKRCNASIRKIDLSPYNNKVILVKKNIELSQKLKKQTKINLMLTKKMHELENSLQFERMIINELLKSII